MLESPTQTSILEWLDLYPELLSGAKRADPHAASPAGPANGPAPDDGATIAAISAQTVLPWGGAMTFHQPSPMSPPPVLGATSVVYRSPGQGGTQDAALAHIAGFAGCTFGQ